MTPMCAGALVDGEQSLPIVCQALHGFRSDLTIALVELRPELLAPGLALRIGHGTP